MRESWKLEDRQAEDSTALHYDHLYDRTLFAKAMYHDFSEKVKTKIQCGKVLELGCGTAVISNILSTYGIIERYCIDFSWKMLQIAKSRCSNCIQADVESLPISDSTFDLVYVHSVLHHFPSLQDIISEVKRILLPGGYFIIQKPNSHNLQKDLFLRICSFLIRKLNTKQYEDLSKLEIKPSDHHAPIRMDRIIKSMEEVGFQILEKKYKYYSSQILSGYDSIFVHKLGRLFDSYYVNKKNDGYMFLLIGKK